MLKNFLEKKMFFYKIFFFGFFTIIRKKYHKNQIYKNIYNQILCFDIHFFVRDS